MTRRWATAHRLAARALLVVVVATLATACTRHWRIAHPQKQDLPLHQSLWAMDGDKGAKLTRKHKRGADTAALSAALKEARAVVKEPVEENVYAPAIRNLRHAIRAFDGEVEEAGLMDLNFLVLGKW